MHFKWFPKAAHMRGVTLPSCAHTNVDVFEGTNENECE